MNIPCVFRVLFVLFFSFVLSGLSRAESLPLWIAGDEGIFHAGLDLKAGRLNDNTLAIKGNLSFITMHPVKPILYALGDFGSGSALHAYKIKGSALELINKITGLPEGGCHLQINPQGTMLSVPYYNSSYFGLYSIDSSGALDKKVMQERVTGSSVHPTKQAKPYPHGSVFNRKGDVVYFADRGTDFIWAYQILGTKKPQLIAKSKSPLGSGPRHIIFDDKYEYVYVSQEIMSGVSVFKRDKKSGVLKLVQHLRRVSAAKNVENTSVSDLQLHPSGQFLYLLNRGFDFITVYAVDAKSGELDIIENEPSRGSNSRHMALTLDGRYLLSVGASSNTVAAFRVESDGGLTASGVVTTVKGARAIAVGR